MIIWALLFVSLLAGLVSSLLAAAGIYSSILNLRQTQLVTRLSASAVNRVVSVTVLLLPCALLQQWVVIGRKSVETELATR